MKKYLIMSLFAVALVGVTGVAADEVTSANAVGYVRAEVMEGSFEMLSSPFMNLDGEEHTPSTVYGDSLPLGTQLLVFDPQVAQYVETQYRVVTDPVTFLPVEEWSNDTVVLDPQVGWWVRPGGDGGHPVSVVAMGEVPSADTHTIHLSEGFSLIAIPYPVQVDLTETVLGQTAKVGDKIFLFNSQTGSYEEYEYRVVTDPVTFLPVEQWSAEGILIAPGKGFWYRASAQRTVEEGRPYAMW